MNSKNDIKRALEIPYFVWAWEALHQGCTSVSCKVSPLVRFSGIIKPRIEEIRSNTPAPYLRNSGNFARREHGS